MIELNRDDPVLGLVDSEVPTATIQEDADGYQRIQFTPDGKAHFEKYLDEEHALAEIDYKPVIDEALRCERIYEAMSDGEELLTIPIAKRDANQFIAYLFDRIWSKKPIFTVTAEEQMQFKILDPVGPEMPLSGEPSTSPESPVPMGAADAGQLPGAPPPPPVTPNPGSGLSGPPPPPAAPEQVPGLSVPASRMLIAWSDEVAKSLEMLVEHKIRKRINFAEILYNVLTQMIKGVSPAWVKVAYEKRTRKVRQTRVVDLGAGWFAPSGTEEVEIPHGDPHKMLFINAPDIIMPADAMDEQEARWLSWSIPMDSMTLRHKVSTGEYSLTPDELEEVLKQSQDMSAARRTSEFAKIDKREARKPQWMHDVKEVWPFWPIVVEDGNVEFHSLCVHYHRKAKKILKAYINPNQNGLRPFTPFFQRKRPDRFSGGSLVQDAAPFQKVISVAMHLQLNNAAQANMVAFLVRSGSTAWNWLSKHKVGPGGMVAVQNLKGEVEPFRLGTDFRSMGEEINFVNNESTKVTTVGDADRDVPNRTAVGTTDIVQTARRLQMNLVLELTRVQLGKVVKQLVQQIQQYDIYGESIPFQNPKTKALIMIPLRMPIETINDQFTFMPTASSEDDTKDQQFMRLMQGQKLLRETRRESLANMGPMFSPQAPPAVRKVLMHSIVAEEKMAGEMIDLLGIVNQDKFILTEDFLTEVDEEHQQWIQQMQQQAQNAPPKEPEVKVSITGKMSQAETDDAAAKAGLTVPPEPQQPQPPPAAPAAPMQGGTVAH